MQGTKSPTEKSSSSMGMGNKMAQNKATDADVRRADEYGGRYRSSTEGVSEDQMWGHNQNPVQNDALPAKNLRSVGPGNA